jgi:hypothetical protein
MGAQTPSNKIICPQKPLSLNHYIPKLPTHQSFSKMGNQSILKTNEKIVLVGAKRKRKLKKIWNISTRSLLWHQEGVENQEKYSFQLNMYIMLQKRTIVSIKFLLQAIRKVRKLPLLSIIIKIK